MLSEIQIYLFYKLKISQKSNIKYIISRLSLYLRTVFFVKVLENVLTKQI